MATTPAATAAAAAPAPTATLICLDTNQQHKVVLEELTEACLRRAAVSAAGWGEGEFDILELNGEEVKKGGAVAGDGVYCLRKTDVVADGQQIVELAVDITPDVELLTNGGDDYDLVTALAELLDNSVQNTTPVGMDGGARLIKIDYTASPPSLIVFDNGAGMTVDGLKNWAILGRHTHRGDTNSPTPPGGVAAGDPAADGHATPRELIGSTARAQSRPGIQRVVVDKDGAESRFVSSLRVVDFMSSDFSRYGVGSKKAVFSIGDTVTVTTKRRDTPWVSQCTLSKSSMRRDGWHTTVTARHPTPEEAAFGSFTSFNITDLKHIHTECYSTAYVKSWLAHIYHYYIFGPDGNVPKGVVPPDSQEGIDENEPLPPCARHIDMVVDGENIRATSDGSDAESLLLRHGVDRVTFDLRLEQDQVKLYEKTPGSMMRAAPQRSSAQATLSQVDANNNSDSSQPQVAPLSITDAQPDSTTVKVALLYFPFKDGVETMPIPAGFLGASRADGVYAGSFGEVATDEQLPLCDRKPGLEVFWNGRLLPREFLEHWPLLRPGRSKGDATIPSGCFRRVKGQIFVDSAFEVTANKHTLSRENALTKALALHTSRTLHQSIRRWVGHCHRTHDEELIFGDIDKDKLRGDGVTHYKSVKITNMLIKMGTHIMAKQPSGRGKLLGKVVGIFTNPRVFESEHGCSVKITVLYSSNTAVAGDAVVPIGLVQRTLSSKEAEEELKKTRKNHPTHLRASLPESAHATASLESKSFKVSMCSDDGKPLRREASLEVECIATATSPGGESGGGGGAKPLIATASYKALPKVGSEYGVRFADFKTPENRFLEFAGVYIFRFSSSLTTVRPLEHILTVGPDCSDLSKLRCIASTSAGGFDETPIPPGGAPPATLPECSVGRDLPEVCLRLSDPFGNAVPFDMLAKKQKGKAPVRVSCRETCGSEAQPDAKGKPSAKAKENSPAGDATFSFDSAGLEMKSTPYGVALSGIVPKGRIGSLTEGAPGEDVKHSVSASVGATLVIEVCGGALLAEVSIKKVRGGKPAKLSVTKSPGYVGWKEGFGMTLCLLDCYGNPASPAEEQSPLLSCEVKVEGNAKLGKSPCAVELSSAGAFCFQEVVLMRPPKQPVPSQDVDVTLSFACFYRVKEKRRSTNLTAKQDLCVKPPSSFPHVLLDYNPGWLQAEERASGKKRSAADVSKQAADPFFSKEYETQVHSTPLDSVVQAVVGAELTRLVAVVHNPPSWVQSGNAVVKCSWDEKFKGSKALKERATAVKIEGEAHSQHRHLTVVLPPISGPTKESCSTHEVTIHRASDETEQLQHRITINYSKGPPAAIKLVADTTPETLQQDKPFFIQCRVTDAFGNELPVKHSQLSGVGLTIHQVAEAAQPEPSSKKRGKKDAKPQPVVERVSISHGAIKARDTTYTLQGLKVSGKAGALRFLVVSSELCGTLKSDAFPVELECGDPVAITVDGTVRPKESPLQVELLNLGVFNPVRIGMVDAAGNECLTGKKSVAFESQSDAVRLMRCSALKAKPTNLFDSRYGVFTTSLIAVAPPADSKAYPQHGTALLSFEGMPKGVTKGHIEIRLLPSRLPHGTRVGNLMEAAVPLSLRSPDSAIAEVEAGQPVAPKVLRDAAAGLTIELLGEDGAVSEFVPPDRVTIVVSSPELPSAVIIQSPGAPSQAAAPPSDAPPITFPDFSSFIPTHAGVYTARVEIDLLYHRFKDALERVKGLKRRVDAFSFDVRPAAPHRLKGRLFKVAQSAAAAAGSSDKKKRKRSLSADTSGKGSAWESSHHLGGVSGPGVPLFSSLQVRVEDVHGNVCTRHAGLVKVRVLPYSDTEGARSRASQMPGTGVPRMVCESWDVLPDASAFSATVPSEYGECSLEETSLDPQQADSAAPLQGSFCLHISLEGAVAEPLVLPFYCTDDRLKQQQIELLAAHKREWQRLVQHLDKKLAKFESRRQVWDAAESKWSTRITEIQQEMLRTKKLENPVWETLDPAALSAQTAKALQKMEQGGDECDGRRKTYFLHTNDALRLVADSMTEANSGVVGIIAEIGWVRDERLDMCLTRALGRYMTTVLLRSTDDVRRWKEKLRGMRSQVPLLSQDNYNAKMPLDESGKLRKLVAPQVLPKGWVGHAANLIELEAKHAALRPVFFNLLSNKVVFDTIDNARAWRKEQLSRGQSVPVILCLDGEKMESSGIEWAGKQSEDPGYRFGRMPQVRSEKYRSIQLLHHLFEKYQALLEEKRAEDQAREPVDPNNDEPVMVARRNEASAKVKQITSILDTNVDGLTMDVLERAISDAAARPTYASQQPSAQQSGKPRKRAPVMPSPEDVGEGSDLEQDSCMGSPPKPAKSKRQRRD